MAIINKDETKLCANCYANGTYLTACSTCTIGTLAQTKICFKALIKANRDAKYAQGMKCTIDGVDYYIKADNNTLYQSVGKDNAITKGSGSETQRKSWVFDGIYDENEVVTFVKNKITLSTSDNMSQLMTNIGDYFERMQQHYGDLIVAVQNATTIEGVQACSTSFSTVSNDVTPS